MKCFDSTKYELMGYSTSLDSYVFKNRIYGDEIVLVRQAVFRNENGEYIRLPRRTSSDKDSLSDFTVSNLV